MGWVEAGQTILVALIAALLGGYTAERIRDRRERHFRSEDRAERLDRSSAEVERAKLDAEAQKRRELEEAAREIREYLQRQVSDLNRAIDAIEQQRAEEREKWNQLLLNLSTKNLELELQHRRDEARIIELEEEAKFIDSEVLKLRDEVAALQGNVTTLAAHLESEQREAGRLRRELSDKTLDSLSKKTK